VETAVQVVWAIGLAGALGGTLVILKQVALILRTLRHIHELAVITRDAARGIGNHLQAVPKLGLLPEPARALAEAERELAAVARGLGGTLGALASALDPRGR
jgi:hypothetical protein